MGMLLSLVWCSCVAVQVETEDFKSRMGRMHAIQKEKERKKVWTFVRHHQKYRRVVALGGKKGEGNENQGTAGKTGRVGKYVRHLMEAQTKPSVLTEPFSSGGLKTNPKWQRSFWVCVQCTASLKYYYTLWPFSNERWKCQQWPYVNLSLRPPWSTVKQCYPVSTNLHLFLIFDLLTLKLCS